VPSFEFDPANSEANHAKHGIDLEGAQALWNDENAFEIQTAYAGETRFARTGRIGPKLWTAIFTYRADRIRLISVRRARADEERRYQAP
jgi:uncharacterized DUF497 family protein